MKMTKESLLKVIGAADDVISALAGTNDEVHKDDTDKMVRLWDDLNDQYAPPEVVRELARLALATMDSEPVGKPFMYGIADPDGNAHIDDFCVSEDRGLVEDTVNELNYDREEGDDLNYSVVALYRHARPAPEKYNIGDATMRHIFTPTGMTNVYDMQAVFDRVEAVLVGMEQPAPVVPDGYVMAPVRLTAENGAKGALSGEFSETRFVNCPECFGDDECETCDSSGRIEITVPVTWTTIKEIWAKGVEHFSATPREMKGK
ncbi:hypothetical protein ACX6VJ_001420 [Klebsiella variicola]